MYWQYHKGGRDISELSQWGSLITGCICSDACQIFHQLMILHYAIAVEAKDFPASQSFVGGINRECIIVKQA